MRIGENGELRLHEDGTPASDSAVSYALIRYAGEEATRDTALHLGQIMIDEFPDTPIASNIEPDTQADLEAVRRAALVEHMVELYRQWGRPVPIDDDSEMLDYRLMIARLSGGGADFTFGGNNIPLLVAGAARDLADWELDSTESLGGARAALENMHIEPPELSTGMLTAVAEFLPTRDEDDDRVFETEEDLFAAMERGEPSPLGRAFDENARQWGVARQTEEDVNLLAAAQNALLFVVTGERPPLDLE